MATVYPTAAGDWSTRTWNDDSTGAAYGMAPQSGDTVLANGLAITIDQDVTVVAIKTVAGTTAAAGGSFTASGTGRTIAADVYAGTTTCLTLGSSNTLNGDSHGSATTNSCIGVSINGASTQNGDSFGGSAFGTYGTSMTAASAAQNGNSTGGSGNNSYGTLIGNASAVQTGTATGGTVSSAAGTNITAGTLNGNCYGSAAAPGASASGPESYINGDAFGGSNSNAVGASATTGAVITGDATGGSVSNASGVSLQQGSILIGNATGGSANNAYGANISFGGVMVGDAFGSASSIGVTMAGGATFFGSVTGGSVSGKHGLTATSYCIAKIDTATGNTAGAYGVSVSTSSGSCVVISSESGSYAKSLGSSVRTDFTYHPYMESAGGGGGSSLILNRGFGGGFNG